MLSAAVAIGVAVSHCIMAMVFGRSSLLLLSVMKAAADLSPDWRYQLSIR